MTRRERGAVLIIAIAILALLSLFATAFARLVSFERRASTNYTDGVRARLLAKAGIKHAMAELKLLAGKQHYSEPSGRWTYGYVPPLDDAEMIARGLNLNLMTTQTPSYMTSLPSAYADFKMFGKPLKISGVLGATYDDGIDAYKLKVIDSGSQLNLNHPDEVALKRMLKNLLISAAKLEAAWGLTASEAERIANYVVDNRPSTLFSSKAEIEQLITSSAIGLDTESHAVRTKTIDRWNDGFQSSALVLAPSTTTGPFSFPKLKSIKFARPALRDLITVYSWVDEKVIRPWNLNGVVERRLRLEARAPININTASKPVLVALLAELQAENDYGKFRIGFRTAESLADAIIDRRNVDPDGASGPLQSTPFTSWPDFEEWLDTDSTVRALLNDANLDAFSPSGTGCDQMALQRKLGTPTAANMSPRGLVPNRVDRPGIDGTVGAPVSPIWAALKDGQALRDLVKAAMNPNTMLNKFGQGVNHGGSYAAANAGFRVPRLVDKADLVSMTTEGCFDSMGVYEITSLGMLAQKTDDPNECQVLALHSEQVVTRIYDVLRLTTQADFEANRAMMAEGDFVPDFRNWKNHLGYNRPKFGEFSGWPGMITNPVYSLERDASKMHGVESKYVPAQYDGNITLSNLLGSYLWKHDFAAGFARGSVEAFKARAWWEPKDQDPYKTDLNGVPVKPKQPTRPAGAYPQRELGANAPMKGTSATTEDAWYDQGEGTWPAKPDFSDLRSLVQPKVPYLAANAASVFEAGRRSGLPDPLDAQSGAGSTTDASFWDQGSSLWNSGIATGPQRNHSGPDSPTVRPSVIAYDSDNLQLVAGSSIRFWVQPLVDPYLLPEEVLFSFVGSQGHDPNDPAKDSSKSVRPPGDRREVGFRVIKRSSVGGISIVLQAVPSLAFDPAGVKYAGTHRRWHHEGSPWKREVVLDVTPLDGVAGTDPFNPAWLPNTWHWIVINYGFTGRDKKEEIDGGGGTPLVLPECDISLQVDLKPTQPPKGVDAGETGRLAFRGEKALTEAFGEVHGYDTTRNVNHGDPVLDMWLGFWTGSVTETETQADGIRDPSKVPQRLGAVTVIGYDPDTYANFWIRQRMLGDFYHCDLPRNEKTEGKVSFEPVRQEKIFEDAVAFNEASGDYEIKDSEQLKAYPKDSYAWELHCEFRDPASGALVTEGISSDGRAPVTYQNVSDDSEDSARYAWTIDITDPMKGNDGAVPPAGPHEWRIDLVLVWYKLGKADGCACCRDGAAKELWDAKGAAGFTDYKGGEPFPDGCYHDSAEMWIHGWPPNYDPNTGARCWIPFKSSMTIDPAAPNPLPAPNEMHADIVCDDCHGCEGCDVDGPMFLGGEPAGEWNYADGGQLAPLRADTVARAVFDNFVIKNTFTRRTDYTPAASAGEFPDWFEDRFFATNMAADYIKGAGKAPVEGTFPTPPPNADLDETQGFGAVYRRGLLELLGTRAKLGTLSWTAYPASEGAMEYEIKLWRLQGEMVSSGQSSPWNTDNRDMVKTSPTWASAAPEAGFPFDDPDDSSDDDLLLYDGYGNSLQGPEILVFGVQLKDYAKSRQTIASDGTIGNLGGLPTPIVETPVFEDVTLTLVRETPQLLYAEEGVAE